MSVSPRKPPEPLHRASPGAATTVPPPLPPSPDPEDRQMRPERSPLPELDPELGQPRAQIRRQPLGARALELEREQLRAPPRKRHRLRPQARLDRLRPGAPDELGERRDLGVGPLAEEGDGHVQGLRPNRSQVLALALGALPAGDQLDRRGRRIERVEEAAVAVGGPRLGSLGSICFAHPIEARGPGGANGCRSDTELQIVWGE